MADTRRDHLGGMAISDKPQAASLKSSQEALDAHVTDTIARLRSLPGLSKHDADLLVTSIQENREAILRAERKRLLAKTAQGSEAITTSSDEEEWLNARAAM